VAAAAGDGSKATSRDVLRRSDSSRSVVLCRKSPAAVIWRRCVSLCADQRRRHAVSTTGLLDQAAVQHFYETIVLLD